MSSVGAPRRPEFTEQGQGRDPMKESTSTVAGAEESKACIENRSFSYNEDTLNLLPVSETHDGSTLATGKKVTELNERSYLEVKLVNDVKFNDFTDSGLDDNEISRTVKGAIPEKSEVSVKNMDEPSCLEAMNCISYTFFSEEEELAFIRSLGWDEHAEEEPLTEEEINSFYQKHNAWSQGKRRLQLSEARTPPAVSFSDSDSVSVSVCDSDKDSYL